MQNKLNSTMDCLEHLVNNVVIKNVSQSAKDRIQAITNKMLAKITNIPKKLVTTKESTQVATTANEPVAEMNPPQKPTFMKVTAGKKVITCISTAQEPPSLRHHPRQVIVIMEEKLPIHTQTLANRIVTNINMKLQELEASFKVQGTSWTHARNLVLIVPTPTRHS